uniref:Uncharacterized protein n=1 Tax=Arundo donax TaxID=35708 RepID=A0A0A9HL88_ARUDO
MLLAELFAQIRDIRSTQRTLHLNVRLRPIGNKCILNGRYPTLRMTLHTTLYAQVYELIKLCPNLKITITITFKIKDHM